MKLDTRLAAGEVVTDREKFLLGIIGSLYDMDCWYLDQWPEARKTLREDFNVEWLEDYDD